jgi:hypothetical protein
MTDSNSHGEVLVFEFGDVSASDSKGNEANPKQAGDCTNMLCSCFTGEDLVHVDEGGTRWMAVRTSQPMPREMTPGGGGVAPEILAHA